MRPAWAARMAALLKPGGVLCTLMFPVAPVEGGPPFRVDEAAYDAVLNPVGLRRTWTMPVPSELSHPARQGKEIIAKWEKVGVPAL